MKYTLFTIILLFLYVPAFAASIDLSSSTLQYDIEDTIILDIIIQGENQGDAHLIIGGIQNDFTIAGQSQQTQILEESDETITSIQLSLLAHSSGTYTLGPITLTYENDEQLKSETISIEVSGERILVNPNIPSSNTQSISNTPQDLSQISLSDTNSHAQDIIGINGEIMQDIYTIKSNVLPKPYHILTFLVALILSIVVWFYKKIFPPKKITHTQPPTPIDYLGKLKQISKKYNQDSKEIFYGELGQLFREYLDAHIETGLSGKSLNEAKDIIPNALHNLYTQLYYPAYDTQVDNLDTRKQIIEQLTQIFKNI